MRRGTWTLDDLCNQSDEDDVPCHGAWLASIRPPDESTLSAARFARVVAILSAGGPKLPSNAAETVSVSGRGRKTSRTPTRARCTAPCLWGEALLTTAEAPTDCDSCHAWSDDERLANRQSPTILPPTHRDPSTNAVSCQTFAAAPCGGGTGRLRSRRASSVALPFSRQVSLGMDAAGSHQALSVPITLPRNERHARTFSSCREITGVPHQLDPRSRKSSSSSHDASQTSDPELPAYLPLKVSDAARDNITPGSRRLDDDIHSSDSDHSWQGPLKELVHNPNAGSGLKLAQRVDDDFTGWDAHMSDASDESGIEPMEVMTAGVRWPFQASKFHNSNDDSRQIQALRQSAPRGGRVEVQAPGHARKPDALRNFAGELVKRHLFQSEGGRLSSSSDEEDARSGTTNPLVRDNSFRTGALSGPSQVADQRGRGLNRLASKVRPLVRAPHTDTAQTAVSRKSRRGRRSHSSSSSSRGVSAARWQQSASASQRTAPAAQEVDGRSSRTSEWRTGPRRSTRAVCSASSVSTVAETQVASRGATTAADDGIDDMMIPSLAYQRTSGASSVMSLKETSSAHSAAFSKCSNLEFELDTDAMGGGGFMINGLFEEFATDTTPMADLGNSPLPTETTLQAAVSERPTAVVVPQLGKQATAKKRSRFRSMFQRQRAEFVVTTVVT